MAFDTRLEPAWQALRIGLGLMALLAGLDKFLNLLTNWTMYLSPLAERLMPLSPEAFMGVVGIVEMAVGLAILTRWQRLGGYVAMAWLTLIALNLVMTGVFYDLAVRDLELAIASFVLARLTEVRERGREAA